MNRTVELCIIAEHFTPIYSGAAERFLRYLPGLCKRGINIQVSTVWHEGLRNQEFINGAMVKRLALPPSPLHPSAELTRQTLLNFKASRNWPDVVHILSHTLRGVPYLWEMRFRGVASINSITMSPDFPVDSQGVKAKLILHQWLRYSVFNTVIVGSQKISKIIKCYGIPSRRIRIIANGVDTSRFYPIENSQEKLELRQKLGFEIADKIILFVGSISRRKGIDLLLDAWSNISFNYPNAKLLLIGPKDKKAEVSMIFDQKIKSLSSNQIKYLEPVVNIELYMQIADILILPSRLEGMPNVVLEGMACGLPCIITPFKGLPESFGRPGIDYLLTTFQPADIAADINSLLSDPLRQHMLGQAALNRVRKIFTMDISLDQHAEIYHYWAEKNKR